MLLTCKLNLSTADYERLREAVATIFPEHQLNGESTDPELAAAGCRYDKNAEGADVIKSWVGPDAEQMQRSKSWPTRCK